MTKKITGLKGLINQIMKILDAKNPDEILTKLKALEEKANKKLEPVFLERVKTKEVPVIIEKVR
jgi:SOS-response transcriptional repressor LexA